MAKKAKQATVVVKCACSVCGQIAHVSAGREHTYCVGFPESYFVAHPAMRGRLKGTRRGVWEEVPQGAKTTVRWAVAEAKVA